MIFIRFPHVFTEEMEMSLIDDIDTVLDVAEKEVEKKNDGRTNRRAESRDRLIDAAYRLFMRDNSRPSDQAIVKAADRSPRTFYQVFHDTEAFWTAVFEKHGNEMRDRVGVILADGNDDTLLRLIMLGRP